MATCISQAEVGQKITITETPTLGVAPFTVTIKKDSTVLYTTTGVQMNQQIGIEYTPVAADVGTRIFSGTVSYTCTADGSTKSITDQCTVTIVAVPVVASIALSGCNSPISPDATIKTCTLTASCVDQFGNSIACGSITWSSSNTSVATVSNGVVTAVSAGTTVITATTTNGKTATKTVTVIACQVPTMNFQVNIS